jgi:hypothetical protein
VRALGWLVVCVAACAPARLPAPPPGPALSEPTDALPADLDLVVRVDLGKMRRGMPLTRLTELSHRVGAADLIGRALERADTVWIGLRPETALGEADNVLVLRGRFVGFDPRPAAPPFSGPRDLGGGWRMYERDVPASRAASARVYARLEDLLVFVSTAEIDSTERAIDKRQRGTPMIPPERGAVSLAARAAPVRSWLAEHVPTAAAALRRATRIAAHADLSAAGLEAELEIKFESADQAKAAADTSGLLARVVGVSDGLVGRLARRLRIESVADELVVRLVLDDRELAELVACSQSRPCALPSSTRGSKPTE